MFPLLYLNNEVLAGVCQRVSAKDRRQLELVNGRVAAVTQTHGSIYRRELDMQLSNPRQFGFTTLRDAVYTDEPAVTVCGLQLNSVGDVRKAVRAMVARCRISRLRISTQGYWGSYYERGVPESAQQSLSSAFADLSTNRRVRPLRAVAIEGDVVQLFGEAGGGVAQLLSRHAPTINELELSFCEVKSDAHTQLHAAAASCVNVQRFDVIMADDSGSAAAVACIGQYKQLKALAVNTDGFMVNMDASGIFEALPRPTQLKELSLKNVAGELPGDMDVRADVFASLRTLHVRDGSVSAAEFVAQLADICPRLEQLFIDGCDDIEWPSLQSLVQRYFASTAAHDLRAELVVNAPSSSQWPAVCADLATNWRADVADVRVACSDADLCTELGLQSLAPAAQSDAAADAAVAKSAWSAECTGEDAVTFELARGEGDEKRRLVLELRQWRDPAVSSISGGYLHHLDDEWDFDEDDEYGDAFADYDAGDFDDEDIDDDY